MNCIKCFQIILLFLLSFQCFAQEDILDTIDGKQVLKIAEKMPEFPGGQVQLMKYIAENIKYPLLNYKEDMQFRVLCTYIVDTSGNLRKVSIVNPEYADKLTKLEQIVLKGIENMPPWIPAQNKGKKVPVRMYLPVHIEWSAK